MLQFLRKFGVDGILVMVLTGLLAGITRVAMAMP